MFCLQEAISLSVRELGLQPWKSQAEKVEQLYSQILVRHGVMLVGPTGGGKTTTRTLLEKALVLLPAIQADKKKFCSLGSPATPLQLNHLVSLFEHLLMLKQFATGLFEQTCK